MTRREALVPMIDHESGDDYVARIRAALTPGNPLSIRVGPAFALREGKTHCSATLWMDVGARSESWQKVSGAILTDDYASGLAFFARVLDADPSAES